MNYKLNEDTLILFPEGRIDNSNAEAFGKEAAEIMGQNQFTKLVTDLKGLQYVSSAGLRQFLKLKKAVSNFTLGNVNDEVYEVLDMTGFNQIMKVEKAFKQRSVEGCEIIGEGSNGVVYRVDPETVVKVYRDAGVLDDIKKERELARKAFVLGINTAISYDICQVGDSYGSVFELVNSNSLTKLIRDNPDDVDKYVKIFVDLLKDVHGTEVPAGTLPSVKETVIGWAKWLKGQIDDGVYQKLIGMVEAVPEVDRMIHGDYHTNNVHYNGEEAILIDMDTLSVGHPVFELASIYNAYIGFVEIIKGDMNPFLKLPINVCTYIFDKFLEDYFDTTDVAFLEGVKEKIKVVAYTRLLRRTMKRMPDEAEIIEHYRQALYEAVNGVDSIVF